MGTVDSERYFKNEFPMPSNEDIDDKELQKIKDECRKHGEKMLEILNGRIGKELMSPKKDPSIYTGTTGIAYLYWYLSCIGYEKDHYIKKARKMVDEAADQTRKERVCTFLCGSAGPLALGAVIYHQLGKPEQRDNYIERLITISSKELLDEELPNELLYGRAGYLYALLFVNKHTSKVPENLIRSVCKMTIAKGISQKLNHLEYDWNGKVYLGAAHGHVGIMYVLLKAKDYLNSDGMKRVKLTIDWLLTQRYPSGNSRSSLNSNEDKLIHFCHGSPGAIHLYIEAHKVFGDDKYLEAAKAAASVVWERGLLKRGYGLCHGVSGNSYTFMAMYKHTKEPRYLRQAYAFAQWCFDYGSKRERIPDRPLSLFEGRAGAIYMLFDFSTDDSKFPAFDI